MKGKFRSMWRVVIALALVLTLGLVAAVPAVAQESPVSLSETGIGVAGWSPDQSESGHYSVLLDAVGAEFNAGRVVIEPPTPIAVEDLDVFSYWVFATQGDPAHVNFYVDVDGDGVWDAVNDDILVLDPWNWQDVYQAKAFGGMTHPQGIESDEANHDPNADPWYPGGNIRGTPDWGAAQETLQWLQISLDNTNLGTVVSSRAAMVLAYTGPFGFDKILLPWYYWQEGVATGAIVDPDAGFTGGRLDTESNLLNYNPKDIRPTDEILWIEIEVEGYGCDPVSIGYVDEVTIDTTTYDLEPPLPPLDEDFYGVGDEPVVTIYDVAENVDPMAIDTIDAGVHVGSTTDTVGDDLVLTETAADTGEFTGTFTLLGAPPADRDLDQIVVSEGDTITLTYSELSVTALVDEAPPTIATLTPVAGSIQYDTTPAISATYGDDTSGIDVNSGVMTVNGDVVEAIFGEGNVTYAPSVDLAVGSTVEVTVDVADNAGNSAVTASWEFSIAGKFNVSVTSATTIPAAVAGDILVEFKDANNAGIQGMPTATQLASVQVTLSGVGIDEDSTVLNTGSTHTFSNVTPEQAGEIIVTFVGTFGSGVNESVETQELTIDVTGFVVEETWADVDLDTVGGISMTVTTKAGEAVPTGIVTITALLPGGFEKDVDDDGELEAFQTIIINDPEGKITYDVGDPEDFSVIGGVYEVTGIKFAKVGAVDILVQDASGASDKAHFTTAFTVLGNDVYTLTFEPASLTAGVNLAALAITITDAGDPVTDVDTITIGTGSAIDVSSETPEDGVYTVNPALVSEEKIGDDALVVMTKNADDTKYGTAELAVELPTLTAVITEGTDVRDLMLVGAAYDYTIAVTALDAQGEPLTLGKVWLGTYDADEETFTALGTTGTGPADTMPLVLDEEDGLGDLVIAQDDTDLLVADTILVWKIGGSGAAVDDAALILEPAIAVEDLYYDLNPTEATVDVDTTYTVTDNYLEVAGNLDVEIVTPSGDIDPKKTTSAGTFKYTAAEQGGYDVYIWDVEEGGWQAPITVTVSEAVVDNPWIYDDNGDGVIDKSEAIAAVWDYFDGVITKELAIEVVWLYFG